MTIVGLIIVVGVLVLILLAVLIGRIDAHAQRAAWNRIGRRR